LRFNKEGNILAVTTVDNGFKILANASGLRSLRTIETPGFEALRSPLESTAIKVVIQLNFLLEHRHLNLNMYELLSTLFVPCRYLALLLLMLVLSTVKWKEAPLLGLLQFLYEPNLVNLIINSLLEC